MSHWFFFLIFNTNSAEWYYSLLPTLWWIYFFIVRRWRLYICEASRFWRWISFLPLLYFLYFLYFHYFPLLFLFLPRPQVLLKSGSSSLVNLYNPALTFYVAPSIGCSFIHMSWTCCLYKKRCTNPPRPPPIRTLQRLWFSQEKKNINFKSKT